MTESSRSRVGFLVRSEAIAHMHVSRASHTPRGKLESGPLFDVRSSMKVSKVTVFVEFHSIAPCKYATQMCCHLIITCSNVYMVIIFFNSTTMEKLQFLEFYWSQFRPLSLPGNVYEFTFTYSPLVFLMNLKTEHQNWTSPVIVNDDFVPI